MLSLSRLLEHANAAAINPSVESFAVRARPADGLYPGHSARADTASQAARLLFLAAGATRINPMRSHQQITYRSSFTPFLPATVLRGPFRVRALVRVRWPRTGNPLRCRKPR